MTDSFIQTGADGSFETDAAAAEAAKVETARAEVVDDATQGQEGSLIMGKYGSVDELESAYKSLQAEYTKLKGGQPESTPEPEPQAQQPPAPQQNQSGITREQAISIRTSMFEQVGGEAQYKAVAGWASTNLPEERLTSFNSALESGDQAQIINQLKGLQYDYMMATGYEPRLARGRAAATESQVKGFESEAQVVAAMNDPRYQNGPQMDPAYIKEVEQRMAASKGVFAGR